ncbi:unnamed protein product [marine sediment metagenome]|uniref:Uncharacterized protein n=1 Tax=marine sediment metagenome TaxID=412755 RepID=X0ZFY3_9ZZZZ
MVTKSGARQVKKALRNTDDILYILTGKRLKHVAGRVVNTFGEDMAKKVTSFFAGPEEEELPPDSPYYILGIHPDAMDIVVKASFRALARRSSYRWRTHYQACPSERLAILCRYCSPARSFICHWPH